MTSDNKVVNGDCHTDNIQGVHPRTSFFIVHVFTSDDSWKQWDVHAHHSVGLQASKGKSLHDF